MDFAWLNYKEYNIIAQYSNIFYFILRNTLAAHRYALLPTVVIAVTFTGIVFKRYLKMVIYGLFHVFIIDKLS